MSTTTNQNYSQLIIEELYRAFDFFNNKFANNTLPKPIILIQSGGKQNACGWFAPNRWSTNGQQIHELTIHQESFVCIDEIFDTLLHEMAHIYNFVTNDNKVVDCTDQQRHNKIFKKAAELFGLSVTQSKRLGFAHTELDTLAQDAISEFCPNQEIFELAKGIDYAAKKSKEKKDKKEPKRKNLVVDTETKNAVEAAAKKYDVPQKEIAAKAIAFYLQCLENGTDMPEEFKLEIKE